MYNSDDTYTCDICGFTEKWNESDEIHGDMWSCEKCGSTFCGKCLRDAIDMKEYMEMMQGGDLILCPKCYQKIT